MRCEPEWSELVLQPAEIVISAVVLLLVRAGGEVEAIDDPGVVAEL
jgi:hypothetical protein